jgi:hypothetical protein
MSFPFPLTPLPSPSTPSPPLPGLLNGTGLPSGPIPLTPLPPIPFAPNPGVTPVLPGVTDFGPGSASNFIGVQGQKATDPGNALNYINPPTDRRLNSILQKTGSPLRQGIIQQTDDVVAAAGTTVQSDGTSISQPYPYACRFMFNPPDFTVGYGINTNVLPLGQMTPAQLQGKAFYAGQTSISFSLLFDRTYEIAYGPGGTYNADLRKIGVYADIAALEAVVGVRSVSTTNPGANDQSGATASVLKTSGGSTLLGNMSMVPVYILFGGGSGPGGDSVGMGFAAYITSMTVNYGLFSSSMVPTRASVQIGATQLVGENLQTLFDKGGTLPKRLGQAGRVSTVYGGNYATGDVPSNYTEGTFPALPQYDGTLLL